MPVDINRMRTAQQRENGLKDYVRADTPELKTTDKKSSESTLFAFQGLKDTYCELVLFLLLSRELSLENTEMTKI